MIDNRGNVKIIDFGYSKNFNEFEMSTAIGSPLYMAPEVFWGSYDSLCDVWSLGIIMYLNFTGGESPYILSE